MKLVAVMPGAVFHLQQIHLPVLQYDIVHADDAVRTQCIVDEGSLFTHFLRPLSPQTGWGDFLHLTFVLGVIVEELVMAHHFGNRKMTVLLAVLYTPQVISVPVIRPSIIT